MLRATNDHGCQRQSQSFLPSPASERGLQLRYLHRLQCSCHVILSVVIRCVVLILNPDEVDTHSLPSFRKGEDMHDTNYPKQTWWTLHTDSTDSWTASAAPAHFRLKLLPLPWFTSQHSAMQVFTRNHTSNSRDWASRFSTKVITDLLT